MVDEDCADADTDGEGCSSSDKPSEHESVSKQSEVTGISQSTDPLACTEISTEVARGECNEDNSSHTTDSSCKLTSNSSRETSNISSSTVSNAVQSGGIKRRWSEEEDRVFKKALLENLQKKTMASNEALKEVQKGLPNRSIGQIRVRLNNMILGKQKFIEKQ